MTNPSSTVNSFLNQERLRQAAALAGPNTDPVAVIYAEGHVNAGKILNKLRDTRAIGVAEVWINGVYGCNHNYTYYGCSRAIWNLSSQTPALSVTDSLVGMFERIDDPVLKRRQAVNFAKENLPQEVFELLGLPTD